MDTRINLTVNGDPVSLVVESRWSLLRLLRERLGLMGTKEGCGGEGECGACTVIVGGRRGQRLPVPGGGGRRP